MAGKDRKKELARQRYERQRARREAEATRAKRVKTLGILAAVVVVLGGAGVAVAATTGGDSKKTGAAATASPSAKASAVPAGECAYTKSGTASAVKGISLPPAKPTAKGTVAATIKTSQGTLKLSLDAAKAPCTVNSFVYLASKKYFDNTQCHRLTTGDGLKVLQCGDPTATGSGGPGYQFGNENLPKASGAYKVGTVAMANAGVGTNGSQFFIIWGDSSGLGPDYTPFGTVTSGLDVVQKVAKAGATPAGDGKPNKKVVIDSFTIAQ